MTDKTFVEHLGSHHPFVANLSLVFDVKVLGGLYTLHEKTGKTLLEFYANLYFKDMGYTVGIVVDADAGAARRWKDLRNKLTGTGRVGDDELDDRMPEDGVIVPSNASHSRLGIWVMPDNHTSGALEDLLWETIPEDDSFRVCAQNFIENVPTIRRAGASTTRHRHTTLALFYSWLATTKASKRIDEAFDNREMDIRSEKLDKFAEWLRKLFAP